MAKLSHFSHLKSAAQLPLMVPVTRGAKFGAGILTALLVCLAGAGFWSGNVVPAILDKPVARYSLFLPHMQRLPNVYLWAWERPEDLRFLHGQATGVAFLAKTIFLKSKAGASATEAVSGIAVERRMQPLRVTPGTPLMAVVRIEPPGGALAKAYRESSIGLPPFSATLVARAVEEIVEATQLPDVSAVQIDFDATRSEHTFYRALLIEVRRRLPAELPLSITALASWCIGDRWLEQLPPGTIDEAVPMLFRMGPVSTDVVNLLRSGGEFPVAACSSSLGLSIDEPFSRAILNGNFRVGSNLASSKRIYLFSPAVWDRAGTKAFLQEIQP